MIHPWQGTDLDEVVVQLPLVDRRVVRSSNGQAEERLVVPMTLRLLGHDLATEVTLSNRDQMGFRLLIGREALRSRIVVDSGHSYLGPRPPRAIRRRNRGR
ncbi:MAG: RimK/LysX family protein [Beutenbergiaceae bacterium]